MTRTMYDSVTLDNLPVDASIVATYINGTYAVNDQAYAAHNPDSVRLYIDVIGDAYQAQIRDWETGDESMNNLEQWIEENTNDRPTIYCNRATISQVRDLTGSKVLGKDYWLWVATLDGTYAESYPDAPAGVVAVQYAGGYVAYDTSIVFDDTWYGVVAPKPVPWYGEVTTMNPGWARAAYPATIRVTSSDGGATWDRAS